MDLIAANWPALGINGLALAVLGLILRALITGQLMSRRIHLDIVEPLRAEVVERRASDAAYQEANRLMAHQLAQAHEAVRTGVQVVKALQEHAEQNTTEQPRAAVGRATVHRGY